MPTFELTGPDGGKYQLTAPDETAALSAFAQLHGDAKPSDAPEPITANKLVRSAATGVPLIGGLLNKANAATNALLAPAVEPFLTKGPETLDQPTFSERYAKSLELQNKQDEKFAAEHPIIDTAAQIAGGVGATLPVAATGLGARALGLGGNTLLGQTARSAASGGAINAADAAIRGNDPTTGGAIGTAIGAAGPVASRMVGAAVSPIATTVRGILNPAQEAERRVAGAITRDIRSGSAGMTPAEFQAVESGGHPINVMELGGETTRDLARSAANTSPEGRAVLDRSINDRFESQSDRMGNWLRSTFHYPNAEAQQAAISNVERTTNRTAYDAAHAAADIAHPGGIWSPELERLTSSPDVVDAMKTAAQRGAGRAVAEGYGGFNPGVTFENGLINFRRGPTGVPTYPDLRFWDYTYRNLRDQADKAFRQGLNSEGGALRTQANALRSELDQMVPEFGTARAGASGFFGAHDAIEAGQNFASPSAKFDNRAARAAIARMSPQERQLFQDGFIDRHAQQLAETGMRRNAANVMGNSDAAIERMHIALGVQRAGQVEAMLHVERLMDLARSAVQGNSTTARQLAQLGLAGGVGTISGGGNPLDPQAIVSAALTYGALRGRGAINERVSRQVAELLASNNHARVAQGMRMIGQQRFLDALRRADTALARAGSIQTEQPTTH